MKRARLIAVLSAVSLLGASAGAAAAGVPPQLSEAESHGLAQAAAERAFAAFVAPPGALASAKEPPGWTAPSLVETEPTADVVHVRGWWVLSGTPGQAIAYVVQHPPAGSSATSTGPFENSPPKPGLPILPTGADFEWPAVPRARGAVRLRAVATPLAGGGTAIEVTATASWIAPRSPAEAIPPHSRLLKISVFPYSSGINSSLRTHQRTLSVTGRRRIERVAALLDALPLAQPRSGLWSCPAPRGAVLRLAFYGTSASTPVAVLRDNLVSCGGVELELNGHGEPALEEGWEPPDLPEQVSEAIGVRLDTAVSEVRGR